MRPILVAALLAVPTALTARPAAAAVAEAPYSPALDHTVTEFPWESGFIPSGGPLQINLGAAAFQRAVLELPGHAEYDWDATEILFRGDLEAGQFTNVLGAEVTATVAIDAFGIMTQVEVGIWNIEETAGGTFTPYLLPGNPDRPVEVAEMIGPFQLVQTPFDIGPATGTLTIDYAFDVPGISFAGDHIDVRTEGGSGGAADAQVALELVAEPLVFPTAEPGGIADAYGTLYGTFNSEVALHLYPTVTVEVMGVPFDIGPFDLPVDFPLVSDDTLVFEELEMSFDVPEQPDPSTGSSGDDGLDGTGDGADAGESTTGDPIPEPGSSTGSRGDSTGVLELPAEMEGGGCGCRTRPLGGAATWWALVLLGLRLRRGRPAPHEPTDPAAR